MSTTTETSADLETRARRCATAALAVGSTRPGGSVLGMARDLARCPKGAWAETEQARRQLADAVDLAAAASTDDNSYSPAEVKRACELILARVQPDPEKLTAVRNTDGWCVRDADGGAWWPDAAAQGEIETARDSGAVAVAMCLRSPMRGRWSF